MEWRDFVSGVTSGENSTGVFTGLLTTGFYTGFLFSGENTGGKIPPVFSAAVVSTGLSTGFGTFLK